MIPHHRFKFDVSDFRCPQEACQVAQPFPDNATDMPTPLEPPTTDSSVTDYTEPLCLQTGVKTEYWSEMGDYYCMARIIYHTFSYGTVYFLDFNMECCIITSAHK